MRVISWLVVFTSISAIAWKGLGPVAGDFSLPVVDPAQAAGTVMSNSRVHSEVVSEPAALSLAQAKEPLAVFRGSAKRNTPEFEVKAPWIIDWRVTTEGGHDSAVDVSLESAGTGIHQGSVLKTKRAGNGVRLFQESGRFYLRVNSAFANWTFKVIELTPEEAARYTPIGEDS